MGLRELKETAHQQFVRGKFVECAATYQRILRLAPRDPNMHVRHAEACRRSGERQQAISSYRTAAGLLLELGCASRARGALKAALELDPRDSLLQLEIAQLESNPDTLISSVVSGELPLLPPLESANAPKWGADMASAAATAQPLPQTQETPPGYRPLPPRAKAPPPAPRQAIPRGPPPVLRPVDAAPIPPRTATPSPAVPSASPSASVPQAPRVSEPVASGSSRVEVPRQEVLRLSPSTLAFRSSPKDSWTVIRSHTPLELHLVEDLENLPPMLQDIPSALMVSSEEEGASTPLH